MEKFPDGAAPASLPCCSVQWPACVPANLHIINSGLSSGGNYAPQKCVTKRCVGAQTDTESDTENNENVAGDKAESREDDAANEMLTESPDEGYEGEPSVV